MVTRGKRYDDAEMWKKCLCGCGKPILKTSKRKYYRPACRVKAARDRRAKGIPAKPTGRDNPRPPDPVQQEIDAIHEAWIRSMVERGEMTGCARCGGIYLLIPDKSHPIYCPSCSLIMSSMLET